MLGQLANILLNSVGLELRRKVPVRSNFIDLHQEPLKRARANGLDPNTIIDVGAAFGDFTRGAMELFSGKDFLMIEPVEEYAASLRTIAGTGGGRAAWVQAVAAGEAGFAALHVHDDLVGSSTLEETEPAVDGMARHVRAIRLDDEVRARNLRPPYLLKVDVQGSELAVLDGARNVLRETVFAILEVSFFDFFRGGASAVEVIAYMAERDFVPYDITGALYRPLDGALAQIDICFARKSGVLRRRHIYASPEQRREQNALMGADLARRMRAAAAGHGKGGGRDAPP